MTDLCVFISTAMRGLVGSVVDRRVSHPVSASDIRRWIIATHHPDAAPAELLADGAPAPEEFNPFAWSVAEQHVPLIAHSPRDPDHFEKNAGVLGPALHFQIAAGLDAEYGMSMRPGDVITAVTTLDDYAEKAGRLGQMLFTTVRHEWTNQHGEMVKISAETSIRYGT